METKPNGDQVRFYKVKTYVGTLVPKDISGYWLQLKLCHGRKKCKSVLSAVYGSNVLPKEKTEYELSINFINGNDRNIYGVADWTKLDVKSKWSKLKRFYEYYYEHMQFHL